MSQININLYNQTSELPAILPTYAYVADNAIVEEGWFSRFLRIVIPKYGSRLDAQVTNYFLTFFKDLLSEKQSVPVERLKKIIDISQQHLNAYGKSGLKEVADLERYALAARIKTNYFNDSSRGELQSLCKEHNKKMYAKWDKLNFGVCSRDAEVFWAHPDLVDFVFNNHLHRSIRHQDYQHRIQIISTRFVPKGNGQWEWEYQPHLLMNGRMTPWSEIRGRISTDINHRLFSIENGRKQYWMYLEEGFVPHDRHDFDHLRCFKKLSTAPQHCQVQLITSHKPEEKSDLSDRLLKGVQHVFFRVVFREGFEKDHPELPFKDGEVYSFGWGAPWRDVCKKQPLASLKGIFYSPDSTEFFAEDLHLTTKEATDEKIIHLIETIRRKAKEDRIYQFGISNCSTIPVEILKETEIADVKIRDHIGFILYKFIFPESWRKYLDKIHEFYQAHTPEGIQKMFSFITHAVSALFFAPLFALLGAWRLLPHYEEETVVSLSDRLTPAFSKISDLFDTNKLSYDLPTNFYEWQKTQRALYPESHHFVKQT